MSEGAENSLSVRSRVGATATAVIYSLAACVAASILASGLRDLPKNERPAEVNRYVLQQTHSDGRSMFDSAQGRMCFIPNGSNSNQQTICTDDPK
jgi:hypothetical protein